MGVPGNANTLLLASAAAGGGAYQIQRSLRFNSGDSAYLNRTPASASNRKTWTWAGWVKRSVVSNAYNESYFFSSIFAPNNSDSNYFRFGFSGDRLFCGFYGTGISSAAVYRDYSAWYHIVLAVDTTQATASNRVRLYVNGSEITAFNSASYPAQNTDLAVNSANAHTLGYTPDPTYGHNGYLADVFLIDGQQLDPSSFTTTDLTTGQLVPKAFTGSYGSNGFKLSFSDNSTTAALGTDTSGAGNTWSVNNFSVTAGSGNDSLVDTPVSGSTVDTGLGGQVTGNYCTWNPLARTNATLPALTNGNLDVGANTIGSTVLGSIAFSSGKWYWEITVNTIGNALIGAASTSTVWSSQPGYLANSAAYLSDGRVKNNGSDVGTYASYTTGDVIGVALNMDAGAISFYKNNSLIVTVSSSISGTWTPAVADFNAAGAILTGNFGQRAWAYTAPTNFKALVDTNLPTPVVAKPNTLMDVVTYTGTGAPRSITGLNFSPDLVWIKERGNAAGHNSYDIVRGDSVYLASESTSAEGTDTDALTAFNSNGFSLGSGFTVKSANGSGRSYVAWAWDAGTSTVTNNSGSISSQVRANPSAGFSVVTWTATNAAATIGHGLGVAPTFIIVKDRDTSTFWQVYHVSIGNTAAISLNSINGSSASAQQWNNTSPTSTVFSVGSNSNYLTDKHVAYCFAPVAGYSSFGTYQGNGSSDGPFVFTGLRPRFLIYKRTDAADTVGWIMIDSARDPYNVATKYIVANGSTAEGTTNVVDFLSNGFKLRLPGADGNVSGGTYIFAAFAESPFQYARAR